MAWAVFNKEFHWSRPKSKFGFAALPSEQPQSFVHDFIDAAVAAGAAVRVRPPRHTKNSERHSPQPPHAPPSSGVFLLENPAMARAVTANFHEMVMEVEWVGGSGTYTRVCGLTSRGISRKSNMQTSEVPDCDDESLPSSVERAVQSQEVTISASGIWAQQSNQSMLNWWYSGLTKNVRIHHIKALSGDTEYESGPAYCTSIDNEAQRGNKVTADISVEFDGVPNRIAKP